MISDYQVVNFKNAKSSSVPAFGKMYGDFYKYVVGVEYEDISKRSDYHNMLLFAKSSGAITKSDEIRLKEYEEDAQSN